MTVCAKVAAAFIQAQEDLKNPPKSSYNPFNNSKYAELSDILNFVRPILAKQGLAIIQNIGSTEKGKAFVKTILLHESGELIETNELCLDPDNNKKMNGLQEMGSAVSYGKRYQLCALLGIAPEEDTDGVSNEDMEQTQQTNSGKSKPNNKPANKPGNKPSSKPNNKPSNKPGNKPSNKPKSKPVESVLEDGTKIEEAKGSKPGGKPVAEPIKDPVDENKLLAKLQKEQPKLYLPLKKKFKGVTTKRDVQIKESHIKQATQELLGEGIYTPDEVGLIGEALDI